MCIMHIGIIISNSLLCQLGRPKINDISVAMSIPSTQILASNVIFQKRIQVFWRNYLFGDWDCYAQVKPGATCNAKKGKVLKRRGKKPTVPYICQTDTGSNWNISQWPKLEQLSKKINKVALNHNPEYKINIINLYWYK